MTFDAQKSYRDNKEKWADDFERRYLKWLLTRTSGNISRAAREADMDRKYLHKLLKKHKSDGLLALVAPEPLASVIRNVLRHDDWGDLWHGCGAARKWELIEVPQVAGIK